MKNGKSPIPPWNRNGTHCDGESSQVLSSHINYVSKAEYGAVAIDLITAIVVTALEVVRGCFIINVTPKQ